MDLWVRLDRNYQIKIKTIVLIDGVFFKKQFNCYVVKNEKEKSQIIPPAALKISHTHVDLILFFFIFLVNCCINMSVFPLQWRLG